MREPAGFGMAEPEACEENHTPETGNLHRVLEQLPAFVWTTDLDLRIAAPLYLKHPAILSLPNPAAGTPITTLLGDTQDAVARSHAQALRGLPAALDFEHNGRHYRARVQALHDLAGAIVGAIGVGVDVTEQQQAGEQIQSARKLEVVARLAGGMAHDLNNVLTIIVSYAQFLLDRFQKTDSAYEDAEVIHDAARRAVAALGKLLAFSRRQVLRPEVVELGALLQRGQAALRGHVPDHIRFSLRLSSETCYARIDPDQMLRAIENLIVNAAEAMPDGGSILVETARIEFTEPFAAARMGVAPGDYVMIAISDTGAGMTKTVREQAFEPFFSTKKGSRGRGLGLSSTYGIVKQSDGHICIDPEPKRGATFNIYLPRVGYAADSRTTSPHPAGTAPPLRLDVPPSQPPPLAPPTDTSLAHREP